MQCMFALSLLPYFVSHGFNYLYYQAAEMELPSADCIDFDDTITFILSVHIALVHIALFLLFCCVLTLYL